MGLTNPLFDGCIRGAFAELVEFDRRQPGRRRGRCKCRVERRFGGTGGLTNWSIVISGLRGGELRVTFPPIAEGASLEEAEAVGREAIRLALAEIAQPAALAK